MTVGLQIFDQWGNLVFDATTRVGRVLFRQRVAGGSGTFWDDRLTTGTPFACFQADSIPIATAVDKILPPTITISGNSVTYAYNDGTPIPGSILAGVY
ncbi:hypothetical protein WK52_00165 [Burkholderia multivorans]|nr:hypothetical protein WK52_00165 [Burkholderia multivorans]